jgi:hypothetical protein
LAVAISPLLSTVIVAAEAANGASRAKPSKGVLVRIRRKGLL